MLFLLEVAFLVWLKMIIVLLYVESIVSYNEDYRRDAYEIT